jgi:NADH:ubiquinone oxidoreductase subunit 3 (subunit A)
MEYNYIALVFFIAVAIFVPFSFLLGARMLRRTLPGNPIKNAPYESAEATIGSNRDIMEEYLPYFIIFLPFEVVTMILLFWSAVARQISYTSNILIIGLVAIATVFAIAGYRLTRDKNV